MKRNFTSFEAGERNYPDLPSNLRQQLARIPPSVSGSLRYFPCLVRLKDGRTLDRVYVVEARSYMTHWGVWPDQDSHKKEVRIEDVAEIHESPSRLPADFATELYRAGESGMGYVVFTVRFSDGTEQSYVTGNAVDFVSLPSGKSGSDIAGVIPHRERDRAVASNVPYYWCIHGSGTEGHALTCDEA